MVTLIHSFVEEDSERDHVCSDENEWHREEVALQQGEACRDDRSAVFDFGSNLQTSIDPEEHRREMVYRERDKGDRDRGIFGTNNSANVEDHRSFAERGEKELKWLEDEQ